jgi:hypothetical protein
LVAAPASGRARVGYRADFVALPAAARVSSTPLSPADRDLYTRPNEGLIQVTPRVRAVAEELAGDERDDWAAVRRIWRELPARVTSGALHYDQLGRAPLDWVLDNGWIDCQLGSALIAGLCRARGIPARLASGYLLYPHVPTQHYWLEIWTPDRGWSPLDRYSWSMSAGQDGNWRDYLLGGVDYRMKTELLPRLFNGGGAARLPPSWRQLMRLTSGGVETSYQDAWTGALVYRDSVVLKHPGEATPPA